jgi:RNA polymerase sigma-70 factor (ECF subfamily)
MDVDLLFREHYAGLVRYLSRRLGDRDWAEEIAQETFVRAMRQSALTSPRSWLYAVATNLVRDEMRRDARRRQRLEVLVAEARAQERDVVPLPVERDDDDRLARAALEQLGERDREALLMREEGLDYGEIAAALELSIGSVGTTLSRARRRLVEAYEALRAAGAEDGADVAS